MRRDISGGAASARLLVGLAAAIVVSAAVLVAVRIDDGATPESPAPPAPITVSTRTLDFGVVPVDGEVVRRLVLRNDGTERVEAVLSVNARGISIAGERELTLEPGMPYLVAVKASPAQPGRLAGELTIALGGHHEKLVVALAGEGASAEPGGVAANRGARAREAGRSPQTGHERAPAADSEIVIARQFPRARPEAAPQRSVPGAVGGGAGPAVGATSGEAGGTTGSASGVPDSGGDGPSPRIRVVPDLVPFDPATAAPIVAVAEPPRTIPVSERISPEEAATATPIHPKAPLDDAANAREDLFEDPVDDPFDGDAVDDDGVDRDGAETDGGRGGRGSADDADDPDPFTRPMIEISHVSTMTLLGSSVGFYPQQIDVLGADLGGPVQLVGTIVFPHVSLAFGESMVFQPGGPVSGTFDAGSRHVSLVVPLLAVDSDNRAAPLNLKLTTGTAFGRTEEGNVVSLSGAPRDPGSGLLKLVAIEQIPRGSQSSVEGHAVTVEIVARLTFGTSIAGGF